MTNHIVHRFRYAIDDQTRQRLSRRLWTPIVLILSVAQLTLTGYATVQEQESVAGSIGYLNRVMDEYHDRFWVYQDVSSGGNHFHAWTKFPTGGTTATMVGAVTETVHSGATSIQCELSYVSPSTFGGFVLQNGILPSGAQSPIPNFGTQPDAGILDLQRATELVFWARGEKGGEKVDFFMGGVGRNQNTPLEDHPDSSRSVHLSGTPDVPVTLTNEWARYSIPLDGRDLSYVLGGFGWGVSGLNDSDGDGSVVFFVDDIFYLLDGQGTEDRLNQPRFLRSFSTGPFQRLPLPVDDFDFILRNTAFTYDNALALIAYLADGSADSVRRAKLIGDAFVYAVNHHRSFDDGRIADAFSCGDIALPPGWVPNGKVGTTPVSGFFDDDQRTFFEVFQDGVSTGNDAWAMIALLALYRETSEQTYLDTAEGIGEFIRRFRQDTGTYRGFLGGIDSPEVNPATRTWASTEHNLDIFAAFRVMHEITGEVQWRNDADHARGFVEAMWNADRKCYLTGTNDPESRNESEGQLPLDTQSWAVLALAETLANGNEVLDCAEQFHLNTSDGFTGFDFNEDKDGVWFEGTAQMATAYALVGNATQVEFFRGELNRAQNTEPFGDNFGIAAASHEGLSTGFGFLLFTRLHVGATSWNVFAQLGFNPYYQSLLLRPEISGWMFY